MSSLLEDTMTSIRKYLNYSKITEITDESVFCTFYRKARNWIFREPTVETQSSWLNWGPATRWYFTKPQTVRESSWWFPATGGTNEWCPDIGSTAKGTSWWKFWWDGSQTEDGSWVVDTFKSVSASLRENTWWPDIENLRSEATEILNTVTQYVQRNAGLWLLFLAIVSVVAVSVLLWCYKSASKAGKRRLRKELELIPDPRITSYLKFIARDSNVSDNAIIARASHSDEFLLTPLSSVTNTKDQSHEPCAEDQCESSVPINFHPTREVNFTVTSVRYTIWFEYTTWDYY